MYARRLRVNIIDGVAPLVSAISLGAVALVATRALPLLAPSSQTRRPRPPVGRGRPWSGREGASSPAERSARGAHPRAHRAPDARRRRRRRGQQDRPPAAGATRTTACGPSGSWTPQPPDEGRVAGLPVLGEPRRRRLDRLALGRAARRPRLHPGARPGARRLRDALQRARASRSPSCRASSRPSTTASPTRRSAGMPLLALRQTRHAREGASPAKHLFDRFDGDESRIAHRSRRCCSCVARRGEAHLARAGPLPPAPRGPRRPRSSTCSSSARWGSAARRDASFAPEADSAPGGVEGDRPAYRGSAALLRRTSIDELPQLLQRRCAAR